MPIPVSVIQRLLRVIVAALGHVIQALENIETWERRDEIVEVIRATMQGNFQLLQEHEHLLRCEFTQQNPHDLAPECPRIHYQYSQRMKPVCQESGGGWYEDGQNISERARDEEMPSYVPDPPGLSGPPSSHHPLLGEQPGLCSFCHHSIQLHDRHTQNRHVPALELPRICYQYSQEMKPVCQERGGEIDIVAPENEDGQNISERARDEEMPSYVSDPPGLSGPLSSHHPLLGEQPGPLAAGAAAAPAVELCSVCRHSIQDVKGSSALWPWLDSMLSRLSPQQLHEFKTKINEYAFVLNDTCQNPFEILRALRKSRCARVDENCDYCLVLYVFRRMGYRELVDQLEELQRRELRH